MAHGSITYPHSPSTDTVDALHGVEGQAELAPPLQHHHRPPLRELNGGDLELPPRGQNEGVGVGGRGGPQNEKSRCGWVHPHDRP